MPGESKQGKPLNPQQRGGGATKHGGAMVAPHPQLYQTATTPTTTPRTIIVAIATHNTPRLMAYRVCGLRWRPP